MADVVSAKKRSQMMAGIKGKNTRPEILIRKALHRAGFRFRLHDKDLPGKPDLVLAKYNAVVFVHGCFWHGHDCHLFKWPQSRKEFWQEKINGNISRDRIALEQYGKEDKRALIIWECALKGKTRLDQEKVISETINWLHSSEPFKEISGK